MIRLDIDVLTDKDRTDIGAWGEIDRKITNFENKANLNTFNYLFAPSDKLELFEGDGIRLLKHFRNECDGSYKKFRTYLTTKQNNMLLTNIFKNGASHNWSIYK